MVLIALLLPRAAAGGEACAPDEAFLPPSAGEAIWAGVKDLPVPQGWSLASVRVEAAEAVVTWEAAGRAPVSAHLVKASAGGERVGRWFAVRVDAGTEADPFVAALDRADGAFVESPWVPCADGSRPASGESAPGIPYVIFLLIAAVQVVIVAIAIARGLRQD